MDEPRQEICPTGERWDPLGAPNDQEEEKNLEKFELDYCDNQ